jgi:hypothetical protein
MMKGEGTLPVGVEFEGVTHRAFVLRPEKVRDSIEAMEDEKAKTNNTYLYIATFARQIEKLGDIPKESITPELLMDMTEVDFEEMERAKKALELRLKSFRGEGDKIPDPGAATS